MGDFYINGELMKFARSITYYFIKHGYDVKLDFKNYKTGLKMMKWDTNIPEDLFKALLYYYYFVYETDGKHINYLKKLPKKGRIL